MWMGIHILKPKSRLFSSFTEADYNYRVHLETENGKLTSLEKFL